MARTPKQDPLCPAYVVGVYYGGRFVGFATSPKADVCEVPAGIEFEDCVRPCVHPDGSDECPEAIERGKWKYKEQSAASRGGSER